MTPLGEEVHDYLDILRRYCRLSDDVVGIVQNQEEVIKALRALKGLDPLLLRRWSDTNYG